MAEADQLLIQELFLRVTALENAATGKADDKPGSALRERLQKERDERVSKKEVESFQRKEGERTGPRPTSQHRREQLEKRTQSLPAPQVNARRPAAPQEAEPTPIDFYCWKDGEIAVIKVLCDGEPTIVT